MDGFCSNLDHLKAWVKNCSKIPVPRGSTILLRFLSSKKQQERSKNAPHLTKGIVSVVLFKYFPLSHTHYFLVAIRAKLIRSPTRNAPELRMPDNLLNPLGCPSTWVGLTLTKVFHHLVQLPSRFCQIPISPCRQWNTQNPSQQNPVSAHLGHPVQYLQGYSYG